MIPFNQVPCVGTEQAYVAEAIASRKLSGDGPFTKRCHRWIEEKFSARKALLTTSGTHALEMGALLCGLEPGDEVILPSFTFSSTANAFILAGARLVFVDIRPDTMNIDEGKIEAAITPRTRVIAPVHYAGVSCEMDTIMDIAARHGLKVVEDAAQGVMSTYRGKPLGTMGDFGCFSFHETKNFSMGEGGALLIRDEENVEPAEILREKGTNRSRFFRGQVDKYTWVAYGSSYLPSELNAAYLWGQLEAADTIQQARSAVWERYHEALTPLEKAGKLEIAHIPEGCGHNAHLFWLKAADEPERAALIAHLKAAGITAVFHYVPLHSAEAGLRYGRFHGEDLYTTRESERLLRLPLYYGLTEANTDFIIRSVYAFYGWG